MGNLCAGGSDNKSNEARIKAAMEEEHKRHLEEGLRNMANGGHQMIAGFTAPHEFRREPGRDYYQFNWGTEGSVLVTSFGVKIVATGGSVEFVEGLANYATFICSWRPWEEEDGFTLICLDHYKSVDANTGEQTPVQTCPKKFLVDRDGNFIRVVNSEDLVNEAIEVAVQAAAGQGEKTEAQKADFRALLMQQRDVMAKGVVDDVALMWRCWTQVWTHEERAGPEETVFSKRCARRRKVIGSDAEENKKTLEKFYDDLFANMGKENGNQNVFRPQVVLEKVKQLQVYNSLFLVDSVRCHQTSYRKFTESSITIQGINSERAEFEGKRWVFGWSDIPELSSRAYMVSLFSEYAAVGGAFHDALTEKYKDGIDVNIFQMLIQHPFITEPNEQVVQADQNKQKIVGMVQLAGGAHSMFSGLSPTIQYKPIPDNHYRFNWPASGVVKVCALGFTIKISDDEVQFTQGLGTFIMFDVRWHRAGPEHGVPGGVEVFLENNVLINAQSGTEESLPEPVKHILVDGNGDLVRVVNMDQLVSYAIDTAIIQKGNISAEEKRSYREMLEKTQKGTLTRAVSCDLAFIWASWVQLWSHEAVKPPAEKTLFNCQCVELDRTNQSDLEESKRTVLNLISSVLGDDKKMEHEIAVQVARQDEHYRTIFERDSIRPFQASYQKVTQTQLAFADQTIQQRELKNSRHVFIWADVPELATKQYIQGVYQEYLDEANQMYSELKARPHK